MKNKIKEGDMVEYKYISKQPYRTFGLVERVEKNKIHVQWLWTENLEGELSEQVGQPIQNCPTVYDTGVAWRIRRVNNE